MLRRKRNREKQTDDFVGGGFACQGNGKRGACPAIKKSKTNKLSGPAAVGRNSSKAFEGGNWRKENGSRYKKDS